MSARSLRGQAASVARPAPPSQPSAPHERLSFFEGFWTVEEVPAERGFRERCSWMEGGRRHMVCRSRSRSAAGEWREGLSMFSYRPMDSTYLYYGLRSGGGTQQLIGRAAADGSAWEFTGDEVTAAGRMRTLVRIARLPNGRFRFVEQTARGDAPFTTADTIHYRPARPESGAP
ncbi:MAG TPA: hypothetical protein VFS59_11985 [Gemmatimonadaceae bacterium]|nr:hypothetical protein [Gemmatimonadaceae bacterium]